MSEKTSNPTVAWEEHQRDLGVRFRPARIAEFVCSRSPWAQSREFMKQLQKKAGLTNQSHLLDAGCSTGQLGFAAAVYAGCKVTMMDYSQEALSFAEAVAEELRRRGKHVEAKFVRGNLENLELPCEFDIVTNQGVLEHWFEEAKRLHVLREMARVTRPGGFVILWVPNTLNPLYNQWLTDDIEVPERAFSVEELERLMRAAGLTNVEVFPARAFLSFTRYMYRPRWLAQALSGVAWLAESAGLGMIRPYMLRLGYDLVGVGRKP